ncbi:MAG: peptidoglycan editing factor PgeF [Lachnospiraceae bacterium]|nr:peptidoglycan editing factor PgeF [Lachnospiraceae bacterium]
MINVNTSLKTDPQGISYYSFPIFQGYPVKSVFTTRKGGVSTGCYDSLNFAYNSGDKKENVRENFHRLATLMGTTEDHLITGDQTHTNHVLVVTKEDMGKGVTKEKTYHDIDALVTNTPGLCLTTAHADCNPIQFYDPVKGVIAATHSGWAGTLKNIAAATLDVMVKQFSSEASDILVGIGPALCQDCFEVDQDVAEKFLLANEHYREFMYQKGIKSYIDLKAIIHHQLTSLGVLDHHIENIPVCTKCNKDLFYSHRNMGKQRGVMVSAIMLDI